MFWLPRRTIACERVLQEEGVYGDVAAGELPIDFIPFDCDVLSLELDTAFRARASLLQPCCACAMLVFLSWMRGLSALHRDCLRETSSQQGRTPCLAVCLDCACCMLLGQVAPF